MKPRVGLEQFLIGQGQALKAVLRPGDSLPAVRNRKKIIEQQGVPGVSYGDSVRLPANRTVCFRDFYSAAVSEIGILIHALIQQRMILNGYQRIQDPAVVADLLPIRLAGFLNFLMLFQRDLKADGL